MRVRTFVILNIGGTVARVVAIWMLGDVFADPILSFNDWIGDHRIQLTLVTFAIVGVGVWRSVRKGVIPIETPAELADELTAAEGTRSNSGSAHDACGVAPTARPTPTTKKPPPGCCWVGRGGGGGGGCFYGCGGGPFRVLLLLLRTD